MLKNNSKYLTMAEVLERINADTSSLGTDYKFSRGSALHEIFRYAFEEDYKWTLPEGTPPYTPSKFAQGGTPTDMLVMIKHGRLRYFSGKLYPNLTKMKREELFIRTLEEVHASEAEVLLLIKDQNLTSKYPNITYKVLEEYEYLPHREVVETEDVVVESPKSEEVAGGTKSETEVKKTRTRKTTTTATKTTRTRRTKKVDTTANVAN